MIPSPVEAPHPHLSPTVPVKQPRVAITLSGGVISLFLIVVAWGPQLESVRLARLAVRWVASAKGVAH